MRTSGKEQRFLLFLETEKLLLSTFEQFFAQELQFDVETPLPSKTNELLRIVVCHKSASRHFEKGKRKGSTATGARFFTALMHQ